MNSLAIDKKENIVWETEGMRSYLCMSESLLSLLEAIRQFEWYF